MASILQVIIALFKFLPEIRWLVGLLKRSPNEARLIIRKAIDAEEKQFKDPEGRPKW